MSIAYPLHIKFSSHPSLLRLVCQGTTVGLLLLFMPIPVRVFALQSAIVTRTLDTNMARGTHPPESSSGWDSGSYSADVVDEPTSDTNTLGHRLAFSAGIGSLRDDLRSALAETTLILAPTSLPSGVVGSAYNQTILASGGTAPYSFAVTTGTLPTD